jgi:hypothetical protein
VCHMNVARLTNEVEAVSQIYASRYGIERDATWFILKLQVEVGELTQPVAFSRLGVLVVTAGLR